MCTELHNFDRQVALLSNWPLPIFISLYLDWTLTRHLMKLVSPPSNHHNIKEKKISLFWPGKDVRDCSITFIIIQSAFNSFFSAIYCCFYQQLFHRLQLYKLWCVQALGKYWIWMEIKFFCGLGEILPVTPNFHQNWIKMIQRWGEIILISYSLSHVSAIVICSWIFKLN